MICSRYIPRAEMSRSAIWSFLCTSQHRYPPGVRTRSNAHLGEAELQSLSRAALSSFLRVFTTCSSAHRDLKKQFLWKSWFGRVIWTCSLLTALPSLCSLLGSVRFVHVCRCGREMCCLDSIPFHVCSFVSPFRGRACATLQAFSTWVLLATWNTSNLCVSSFLL